MADRGDTHYSVTTLNRWFLFSSAFFLVSLVWLMLDDWKRPWKDYQREFRGIELARAEAVRGDLEEQFAAAERELAAKRDTAESSLADQQGELDEALEELRIAEGDLWRITEEAKKDKADFNWDRYVIEEERSHTGDQTYGADELVAAEDLMNASALEEEKQKKITAMAQEKVNGLTAARDNAEANFAAGTRDLKMAREAVENLDPSDFPTQLAEALRDAPGLDFVGPNLKPKKVVLDNLTFELNFTKKKRLDMCHTCHLAVDRDGYQDEVQPFSSHPRLDLFLTGKSPHPLKDVGCTICHRGSGESLEFNRADHRPDVSGLADFYAPTQQVEEWHDDHHWHKQHHWDYPMLPLSMTEASCVQCHKTSMELIAEDAPEVSAGYQKFERYGCYSCHKVDWFPTKRKPGPSLKNIQAKASSEWMASWIANPRAFRPSTWMPQIFHLENYAPDEVVAVSNYGEGPEVLGQAWNETAVAAVTAFINDKAPLQELAGIPVEGDPVQGAETFRLIGCLACHNMAPWEEDPNLPRDPSLERRGTNEHGPNLRGVATKVDPTWLYHWIKDPAKMWSETRMPNLRLTDQEAADIVAYMIEDPDGYFSDVPEGWEAKSSPIDEVALQEMARWFFARDGRTVVADRLAGNDPERPWNKPGSLLLEVGEKMVQHYGCYSCHEIEGMETMMPIGVELTNWASKTVDKLDFGFMHHILAEEHGWDASREEHFKHYREGWLMNKLTAPRSYDRGKVKNPIEKLRMPWFDFDEETVHEIATFVAGLVDDEVQRAKMLPNGDQLAKEAGMRAVRQQNCMACHMVEPGTVTFRDGNDELRTITAELLPIGDSAQPVALDMTLLGEELEYWEEDEVPLRLLREEPGLGKVGDKFFLDSVDQIESVTAPKGGDLISLITDYYYNGQEIFDPEAEDPEEAFYGITADPEGDIAVMDADGKYRPYYDESYDKVRWTFAPPVLWDEGAKVHKDWFFSFLKDVQPIRPQLRVRMPSFNFLPGEAGAIADYFALKSAEEWAAGYTRGMLVDTGADAAAVAEATKIEASEVAAIENGDALVTSTKFGEIQKFAGMNEYEGWGPVDPSYEAVLRRSKAYLDGRAATLPAHMEIGENLAANKVNCYQCHFRLGNAPNADPVAWAPDLATVSERLREDWTQRWLINPSRIYPGTSMPQNFADNAGDYHDVYPDSTNAQQIETVLDWLYNFDRIYMTSQN